MNSSDATSAANMRIVVRTAYSGRFQGSRFTSVAPGASIGTIVPRATCATAISAPKTQIMATTSQTLGNRRPEASAAGSVKDMGRGKTEPQVAVAAC